MKTFRTELKELYLDWYNNYLTVGKFAEHHGMQEEDMEKILDLAKKFHFYDADNHYRNGLSLSDIETAIYNGFTVYWKNSNYQVIKDKIGQYLIKCSSNSHCVGLTKADGTLRDDPKDFFLGGFKNG